METIFSVGHSLSRCVSEGRGKIGYLTGDKTEPHITDAQHVVWDAKNSMVMSWLVNSMEEVISANYLGFSTTKEMWTSLKQMYSDLGDQSQIYELELKIGSTKQGTNSATIYFASLTRLWQDLDMFYDHKLKDLGDGVYFQKVTENSRIFKFLASLSVKFDEVRGRIIGRQPLPSLNDVFAEVRRGESRQIVMLGKKKSEPSPVETSALVLQEVVAHKAHVRKNEDKPKGTDLVLAVFEPVFSAVESSFPISNPISQPVAHLEVDKEIN
ncbi:hypothetical protein Dsin_005876 [Dipteronia sinensis]|uniref:Retrotransposon gag domain-containing protein n=1 Tax=Dipteronia sinensis TaxID=43782 RepID=A0AAE0EFB2_9ROSI|nr:hypothetical protein Dsin_005876 [Dipteronia sinensis]